MKFNCFYNGSICVIVRSLHFLERKHIISVFPGFLCQKLSKYVFLSFILVAFYLSQIYQKHDVGIEQLFLLQAAFS